MKKKSRRTKINKFIEIMKTILNQQLFEDIIKWNDSGIKILILDKQLLQTTVLPKFFKHANYASFLRQLNTYGFKSCREANNLTSYTNPAFTRVKVIRQRIKKRIQQKQETLSPFSMIEQEYEKLRDQMLVLKQEQDKINENLRESIQCQMKIQTSIKKMFLTRMHIAYTGITCTQQITKNIKTLVSNMVPEIQQAYSVLFTTLFPECEGLKEMKKSQEQTQFLFSPLTLGSSLTPQVVNFSPFFQYQDDLNMNFCSLGFQQ